MLFAGCDGEAREAGAGSLGPAGAAVQGRGSSQEGQGVCGQAHPSPHSGRDLPLPSLHSCPSRPDPFVQLNTGSREQASAKGKSSIWLQVALIPPEGFAL